MRGVIMASVWLLAFLAAGRTRVELPGENDCRPPVSFAPFPDRMSAFLWRNWFLVPHDLLARVVSAKESDLEDLASQMGLPKKVDVLPEWRHRGYITVLRRNWHLLPYDQLLPLLGMTRDELRFSLVEDDALWVKLGGFKPKCEVLRWTAGMSEDGRGRRVRIAEILKEEGVDPAAPEESRFSFVRELATPRPDWKPKAERSDSPFGKRVIFSYFADYADPLWDEEVGSFPEGLLQRLADLGVNGVWLHTVLRTLVKDPGYPEFGEGCERRLANLQKLVDRCARYGIKVYLYMNEPRGMDPPFFERPGREGLGGATYGGLRAMCTSSPETHRWVRDSLRQVFSTVHGVGGIFTITASENLTNCATRPKDKETCPRCKDRTRADVICEATGDLIAGMQSGDPNAEALVYNWAWGKDDLEAIIAGLPKGNVRIMSVSERHIPLKRGGVPTVEQDYSISVVGPGAEALETWRLARANGAGVLAKVQACNSWEISSFPYVPAMDLVAQHAVNLANAGVDGVMLSWSLGCYPAVNLGVYRDLRRGEKTIDPMLDRLAEELYGKKGVARVRQAWKAFSDGFANFPFSKDVVYAGPQQWGPANPLYPEPTGCRATMVGFPYDAVESWCAEYPPEIWIGLMQKVADGFKKGCALMEGVASERELNMFRGEWMDFASCADQARFVLARNRGDKAEMRRLAKAELERAKSFLPIVRADSRIGFESSNQYFYVPIDVVEKIVGCRLIIDAQDRAVGDDGLRQGPFSRYRFDAGGSVPALYYDAYRPVDAGSQAEVAIVLIHGWGGHVKTLLPIFTEALSRHAGSERNTPYVMAPMFPRRETLAANGDPDDGRAVWGDSWADEDLHPERIGLAADDWRGGGDANGTTFSSYDYIDRIFAVFADRTKYPNLKRVILAGFSAGGQFAGRYAATGKGVIREGVRLDYIAMSPSTEFRFDSDQPWLYGLKDRPRYSAALTEDQIMANLCSRRVWRGCGSLDVKGRPETSLDMTPPAIIQGDNRFERFKSFEKYLERYPDWKRQVSFHVFEGLGHKEDDAFPDPAVMRFIFGE